MSVPAMLWAWEQPVANATERLVLLALADNANGAGECWPSLANIAERCRMHPGHVRRTVTALTGMGLVEKVRRHRRADGTFGVWHYRLPVDNSTSSARQRALERAPRALDRARVGARAESLEPIKESLEASLVQKPTRATTAYAPAPLLWCPQCNCLEIDCWTDHERLAGMRLVRES